MTTEFLNKLNLLIQKIQAAPLIENSFFILGAGKFGKIALKYANAQPNSPYILVIDKKFDRSQEEFQDFADLVNLHEVLSSDSQRKFFLQEDIGDTSELIQNGFPEHFVPAVPVHAVAYILEKLYSSLQPEVPLKSQISLYEWVEIVNSIPKQVILKKDPKNGVILLSWAKMNEICPSNCIAPIDYCPHHHRNKPHTITEIVKQIKSPNIWNFTLESHQVQPGLGVIYGKELKSLVINCLKQIHTNLESNRKFILLIATTCNCHGVINGFACSSL